VSAHSAPRFTHTSKPEVLVLADDLTGALEAGSAFAQRGVEATVFINGQILAGTRALVIDTETRHVSADGAAEKIRAFAQTVATRLTYKKTDSTLRGNIRAELSALAQFGSVVYVPAYPQLGRTLINRCLHINGVPISETAFASDPLHPITDGSIAKLLEGVDGVSICEANTESEIQEAARKWLATGGFAAGPTAMLHAAAQLMGDPGYRPPFPEIHRALIVSGSRHQASREQLSVASTLFRDAAWTLLEAHAEHQGDPLTYAANFGSIAARLFQSGSFDALIVFGGDTAYHMMRALKVTSVEPLGEAIPGVPVSRLPDGRTLVTKAGGFGSPDILLKLHAQLTYARL
jgi:D-threonate/D-erythronate kinase